MPPVLWISICIIAGFAIIYGLILWLRSANRSAAIADIKHGKGIFLTFNYTSEEWKYATENYFDLKCRTGDNGKVCFTPRYIYLSNGRKDILHELVGANRFSKHLTEIYHYKSQPMNVVRFDVRTIQIHKGEGGTETMDETYKLEQYSIPIPKDYRLQTDKLMKFYQDFLDKNADAVAAVMPYGLGLFK